MQLRDAVVAVIALILAVFVFNLLWAVTTMIIKLLLVLIVAYVIYLFLKKL